jgi:hypothetical protein
MLDPFLSFLFLGGPKSYFHTAGRPENKENRLIYFDLKILLPTQIWLKILRIQKLNSR